MNCPNQQAKQKHVKLEFDEHTYELIREAAWLARKPIKHWCATLIIAAATEQAGGGAENTESGVAP